MPKLKGSTILPIAKVRRDWHVRIPVRSHAFREYGEVVREGCCVTTTGRSLIS